MLSSFLSPQVELLQQKMQSIDMTFIDFLERRDDQSSQNLVKCGVEAVKLGLLDKDCVNRNGDCLALVLLEFALLSTEQEACMLLLCEFFDMKPCLRKVLAALPLYGLLNSNRFVKFCMSFEYFWTDRLAVQQYWWAMPMDVHKKWSPCRVAWIWAVVQ